MSSIKVLFGMKKGGCGKTTMATQTASLFASEKKKVLLVDTDENQSAMQYRENRPSSVCAFQAVSIARPSLKDDLDGFDHDVIVVDSGGRDSRVFRAGLMASDFFVLPVQASEYDIRLLEDTLEVLRECREFKDVKAGIIQTMVMPNPRMKITHEADDILKEIAADFEVELFKTKIFMREPYVRTAERGMSVCEIWEEEKAKAFILREKKYEKPHDEMMRYFSELKGFLNIK